LLEKERLVVPSTLKWVRLGEHPDVVSFVQYVAWRSRWISDIQQESTSYKDVGPYHHYPHQLPFFGRFPLWLGQFHSNLTPAAGEKSRERQCTSQDPRKDGQLWVSHFHDDFTKHPKL
jgi:hypothetical protein